MLWWSVSLFLEVLKLFVFFLKNNDLMFFRSGYTFSALQRVGTMGMGLRAQWIKLNSYRHRYRHLNFTKTQICSSFNCLPVEISTI